MAENTRLLERTNDANGAEADRSASGFEEFERFVRGTGAEVFLLQRQACSACGGAVRWQKWYPPETVRADQLLLMHKSMLNANRAGWNPIDWHVRMIGTPPVWVLDDLSSEDIAQMYFDMLPPFAIVETSQGNYQVWARLQSNEAYLRAEVWHTIHYYLCNLYESDRGAGGAEHAFRLPLPGAVSHKRAEPYKMKVSVHDNEPSLSVGEILLRIPLNKKESDVVPVSRISVVPDPGDMEGIEIPGWFRSKWEQRREEIISAESCPHKTDGTTPDWSAIDYRLASRFLYGYRNSEGGRLTLAILWITKMIEEEAEKRGKPRPAIYARRTAYRAARQLGIEIDRTRSVLGSQQPR